MRSRLISSSSTISPACSFSGESSTSRGSAGGVFRLFFNNLGSFDSIEFLREFINILAKIFNVLFSGIAFRLLSPVDQLLIGLFIGILFWLFFSNLKLFNDLFFRCGIVSCSLFAR